LARSSNICFLRLFSIIEEVNFKIIPLLKKNGREKSQACLYVDVSKIIIFKWISSLLFHPADRSIGKNENDTRFNPQHQRAWFILSHDYQAEGSDAHE
jgi:hypothetical protein